MSTLQSSTRERNTVQAINALKRGSYLLKYGRWGKPTFCPFRLSNDETTLIWYVGKEEKQLRLSQVSRTWTAYCNFPEISSARERIPIIFSYLWKEILGRDMQRQV